MVSSALVTVNINFCSVECITFSSYFLLGEFVTLSRSKNICPEVPFSAHSRMPAAHLRPRADMRFLTLAFNLPSLF